MADGMGGPLGAPAAAMQPLLASGARPHAGMGQAPLPSGGLGGALKSPAGFCSGAPGPPKATGGADGAAADAVRNALSSGLVVDKTRRGPQPTFCEHQLPKSKCKTCKSKARVCKHEKKKELCRECDGSALCVHDLRKKVRTECTCVSTCGSGERDALGKRSPQSN